MESIKNFLSIKKIYIIPLIAICIFFSGFKNVYAELDWNKVSYECVYNDGSVFTYSLGSTIDSEGNEIEAWNINRDIQNIRGSSSLASTTTGAIAFTKGTKPILSSHNCYPYVMSGTVETESDADDDAKTVTTYYRFIDNTSTMFNEGDIEGGKGFWWWYKGDYTQANDTRSVYKLVSESISIDGEQKPNSEYYYKNESEQYSSKAVYVTISNYGNVTVLTSGDRATILEGYSDASGAPETIWLNDPAPKNVSTSTGSTSFYYDSIRYSISSNKDSTHTVKFIRTETDESGDGGEAGSLCDDIPETAKVLKKIIQVIQLLVPALLIVLCGIDIGKAVFSGKIDEEIPKMRTRLIRRAIAAVTIFFLPLVINILINGLNDSINTEDGAGTIDTIECLFE